MEAAAVAGIAIGIGRLDMAAQAALRLGIEVAFVIGGGIIAFGLKQLIVHRRSPLQ